MAQTPWLWLDMESDDLVKPEAQLYKTAQAQGSLARAYKTWALLQIWIKSTVIWEVF